MTFRKHRECRRSTNSTRSHIDGENSSPQTIAMPQKLLTLKYAEQKVHCEAMPEEWENTCFIF